MNKEIIVSDFEKIFEHLNHLSWRCDIDKNTIFQIARSNYKNFVNKKTKLKKIYRVAGQSGSGKTTQLMKALDSCFLENNTKPVHFAVRKFASFHPNYSILLENFGKSEIREKTNGFALRCLLMTLIFAINDGYLIMFEVTLLSKEFEQFILKYLQLNNYERFYLCLSVNKEISDYFIDKRKLDLNNEEKGRIIYKASADFFYDTLTVAVEYLIQNDPKSRILIWNAYSELPVFDGKIINCIKTLKNERERIKYSFSNENKLLCSKISYLSKNLF